MAEFSTAGVLVMKIELCEIHECTCTVLSISKENKNIKGEETDQFAKPLTHGVSDPVHNFVFFMKTPFSKLWCYSHVFP